MNQNKTGNALQTVPNSSPRRRMLASAAALGLGAFVPFAARAQAGNAGWKPVRPLRIVVPYPPAGGIDIVARFIAPVLEHRLGQPVVVDNRPGAVGMIGSEYVYRAAPDGYTYIMASADTHSINPHVYTEMRYDARRFTPVVPIAGIEYVLAARPDLPAGNVRELVDMARGRELTYGSSGVGSSAQAVTEDFKLRYGLKLLHVPYAGSGPVAAAAMGGQIDIVMLPTAIATAAGNRLKLLGLVSTNRFGGAPDLPTLAEQGFPIGLGAAWVGLLAPPDTPAAPVESVYGIVDEFVRKPEARQRLQALGMIPMAQGRDAFRSFLAGEYEKWGEAVRAADIRVDNRKVQ